MNVSLQTNHSVSFCAKNSDIKKADKIMRTTRNVFPMQSCSFIDTFYSSKKARSQGFVKKLSDKIWKKIDKIRTFEDKLFSDEIKYKYDDIKIGYAPTILGLEQLKAGNCHEASVAVLAALAANGIYDGKEVNLFVDTQFMNKKTKQIEYWHRDPIDHALVVTAMGKENPRKNDLIVIDPWLPYCDSLSGAIGKYNQVFAKNKMREAARMNRSLFRVSMAERHLPFDEDNYEMIQKIKVNLDRPLTARSTKELGDFCSQRHPELIID